jgi:hypothetical protein
MQDATTTPQDVRQLGPAIGRIAGGIVRQLEDQVLAGVRTPQEQALLERSARTLASAALAGAGGDGTLDDPDAVDRARAAMAVLASLASAEQERAAAAVRRAVEEAVGQALRVGLAALLAALA